MINDNNLRLADDIVLIEKNLKEFAEITKELKKKEVKT